MPVLFVSHGAPTIVIDGSPAHHFLKAYGPTLPRPRAYLVVSAHYERARPTLTADAYPNTVHDFGGFPAELYRMTYPAPGAPELAREVQAVLANAGIAADLEEGAGIDHGVWTPLILLRPEADVPVVALSINPNGGPEAHWRLGQALAPLREAGVMIIGSGAVTHNLMAFMRGRYAVDAPAQPFAAAFADWVAAAVQDQRVADLLAYRTIAPHGRDNHPTEEHFLPFFVALGAGSGGERVHASVSHGVLAMDVYAF